MDKAIKSFNKINGKQKTILADFMMQHRNLATNNIPNSREGKIMANRLWAHLKVKLNAEGPPHKDVKMWRKVFSDIKHQIKKKFLVNRIPEDPRRGGQIILSREDEQIIKAAGLDTSAHKNLPLTPIQDMYTITEIKSEEPIYLSDAMDENDKAIFHHDDAVVGEEATTSATNRTSPVTTKYSALSVLNDKLKYVLEQQDNLNGRLTKLLEITERSLQMKEEEHAANMALKTLELKIKKMELEMLRAKSVVNIINML